MLFPGTPLEARLLSLLQCVWCEHHRQFEELSHTHYELSDIPRFYSDEGRRFHGKDVEIQIQIFIINFVRLGIILGGRRLFCTYTHRALPP